MVKAATTPVKTAPAAAAEEEPAFPRGGRQPLSALERKRLRDEGRAEAEKDFLSSSARKKKRKEPALEVRSRWQWQIAAAATASHVPPVYDSFCWGRSNENYML